MKLPSAAELTGSNPDHPETQNALLARLEREIREDKADAEALRALGAWVNADKGWRRVSGICSGERFEFEVTIRFWRGTDGQQEVSGEADTLAGAIMDALSKAAR